LSPLMFSFSIFKNRYIFITTLDVVNIPSITTYTLNYTD
jgi:hypothetical protein